MTNFYSRNDVNYNGDVYSIPFPYIKEKEIQVFLDDTLFEDWFFLNDSQIKLRNIPQEVTSNTIVSVRRITDIDKKVVTYTNNTLLNKENLNLSQDQLLYAVQEIYDNNTQFAIDIRAEVDEKVEKVSDAVEKLEFLEDSVAIANEAALEATEKAEETLNTYNEAMTEIDTLRQDSVDEVNQLVADHTDALNALDQLIKKDADAIINRVGFNMFDTVLKDHILTYEESKGLALQGTYVYKDAIAGSRYGYADFYNKCLEEREEAIANGGVQKVTLGGTSMSMYIHPNGHMYYDISMKTTVDNWFNTFGTAWFYGVDIKNKRIFLPRNNWFEQMTTSTSAVGKSVEAGLPNHKHTLSLIRVAGNGWGTAQPAWGGDDAKREAVSATTDNASVSNSIYGKSNTVQPNAVKKLLYICVGNKVQNLSTIDIVTQVDNGVKEIDDAYNKAMSTLQAVGPVLQTGSTMTGDITFKKSTNTWSGLQVKALGEAGVIPTSTVLGGRFISFDNKNAWWATVQQSLDKDGASHIWLCSRNTSDGVTYKNHTLSIKSYPDGSGGTYIDGKLVKAHVTETYRNGASWYRVYSDGWCEQGGRVNVDNNGATVTFLKAFSNTNYTIQISQAAPGSGAAQFYGTVKVDAKNAGNFRTYCGQSEKPACDWYACGY